MIFKLDLKSMLGAVLVLKLLSVFLINIVFSGLYQVGDSSEYFDGSFMGRNDFRSFAYLVSYTIDYLKTFLVSKSAIDSFFCFSLIFVIYWVLSSTSVKKINIAVIFIALISPGSLLFLNGGSKEMLIAIAMILSLKVLILPTKSMIVLSIISLTFLLFYKPVMGLAQASIILIIYLSWLNVKYWFCFGLCCVISLIIASLLFTPEISRIFSNLYVHFDAGEFSRQRFDLEGISASISISLQPLKSFFFWDIFSLSTSIAAWVFIVDSFMLSLCLLVLAWPSISRVLLTGKITQEMSILFLVYFVYLTAHAPYGLYNIGSSVRYRAGWFVPAMLSVAILSVILQRRIKPKTSLATPSERKLLV